MLVNVLDQHVGQHVARFPAALSCACSYLKNMINKFNSLKEVITGPPQGSIDGSLLSSLFANVLFCFFRSFYYFK